jgi:hypothetical protein
MKHLLLSVFFLASLAMIVPAVPALAQTGAGTSIAGDDLCGKDATDKCTPEDLRQMAKKVVSLVVVLGTALLVIVILYQLVMSWFAYANGDTGAIKRAGVAAFNRFIGFAIVIAVAGGFLFAVLTAFGTKPEFLKLLQFFSSGFIEHAHAQTTGLQNPLGSNSLYDILLSGIRLILQFFIYPALIAMWVWSGFQFIYARGNPTGLQKAKAWLLWAFIITLVAFALQGFLAAFKGTADIIIGS